MAEVELQQAFERCLSDPLDQIAGRCGPGATASRVVDAWNLPASDRQALISVGVPIFEDATQSPIQLAGEIQSAELPSLTERGYLAYRIGRYWRREIGVLEQSGTVVGFPDDAELDVSFLNSSLAAFLEIAWRWNCARKVLLATEDYEQLYENLGRFQDYVHSLDPIVSSDPKYAWWNGIVEGW